MSNKKCRPPIWTPTSIDCYERHCICEGCIMKEILTSKTCDLKKLVIQLVALWGPPEPNARDKFGKGIGVPHVYKDKYLNP